jgi:hypothetical protein
MRLLLLLLLHAQRAANQMIDVRIVGSEAVSAPVARGFTSFSCADTILDILSQAQVGGGFAPRPSFVALLNLLGGGGNIRLGHWWAPNNVTRPLSYPEANASNLARVSAALGAFRGTATPLIPPVDSTGSLAAATGAAFLRYLPRTQLSALELANEPDISSFRGNFSRYMETLGVWLAALEGAGLVRAVEAPVLAGSSWWPNMGSFLRIFAPRLHAFSQHRYGLSACSKVPPTLSALMQVLPTWTSFNDSALLAAVGSAGLPFHIGEGNTVACNGTAGVSDAFGAALYALDASLCAMSANISSLRWHGLGYEADFFHYQPIYYATARLRDPGADAAYPRPLFLGLWMLAEAAPEGSVLLFTLVNASGSKLLRAWALRRPPSSAGKSSTAVVVLHKEDATMGAALARISPPSPCAAGSSGFLTRLLPGPGGLAAQKGNSYGNQSFDGTENGIPKGERAVENVPCDAGRFEFTLPAASAAVLVF